MAQVIKFNAHSTKSDLIIDQVVTHGFCSGCGLCQALAPASITMRLNASGYLRPLISEPLNEKFEPVFKDVCPGLKIEHDSYQAPYHPIWGPILEVRTGHATDPEIRHRGSSGGVISAMAIYLLEQGLVDFVAQIAVSHTDPLTNVLQISKNRSDVMHAAGSRYAPSAPLNQITDLLERGERFAFIGKPCDIAALRRYAHHDRRVNQLIPYMLSFMCAGIPSQHGTDELLDALAVDRTRLKSFRYRGDGWPGMAKAETIDGQIAQMDYNSSWGGVLNRHLQFRCKICPDGTGEFADIVCADAWYGKEGYPDFTEQAGRSLLLIRTPKGKELTQAISSFGSIAVSSGSIEEIALMQPYQKHRKQVVLGRLIASWLALRQTTPRYKKLSLLKAASDANLLDWLRNTWGTFRRAKGEQQ